VGFNTALKEAEKAVDEYVRFQKDLAGQTIEDPLESIIVEE